MSESWDRGGNPSRTSAPMRDPAARHLSLVPPVRPADASDDGALQSVELGPIDLEMGGHLAGLTVAFRTWGNLNAEGTNAVIVLHALTGDSKAAGEGGWWAPLIGPGKAIDTDQFFVVCANLLGGCQGTTGPQSTDPATGQPYGPDFPLLAMTDLVTVHRRLLDHLGIDRVHTVVGGSLGGMQ